MINLSLVKTRDLVNSNFNFKSFAVHDLAWLVCNKSKSKGITTYYTYKSNLGLFRIVMQNPLNFDYFFYLKLFFLMFLNRFNMLMSKIIFKK
jgi:hypothetical protein